MEVFVLKLEVKFFFFYRVSFEVESMASKESSENTRLQFARFKQMSQPDKCFKIEKIYSLRKRM